MEKSKIIVTKAPLQNAGCFFNAERRAAWPVRRKEERKRNENNARILRIQNQNGADDH